MAIQGRKRLSEEQLAVLENVYEEHSNLDPVSSYCDIIEH